MNELVLAPARHGPFPGRLAPEAIAAYAEATGDHTTAARNGLAVPAVFPVLLVFEAQEAARMHLEQFGADATIGVEQWWTMVLLGLTGVADLGSTPADHRFPEVSGDWSAHHFDIEVARAAGFDFVFAHGLCTMAICAHRLLNLLGVGDPGRVSRVAVRFASPTPLDEELTVNASGLDQNSVAFEATSRGVPTITHGRLELRP